MRRYIAVAGLLFAATNALAFEEVPASSVRLVPSVAYYPLVASNGRNFVLTWDGRRATGWFVFRAVVDAGGTIVDSRPIGTAIAPSVVGIASDGDSYLIATESDGALLLDGDGTLQRSIPAPWDTKYVASDGTSFLLATDRALQLLDRNGAPIGPPIESPETIVGVAGDGGSYLVATTTTQAHLILRTLSRGILSGGIDAGAQPTWDSRVVTNGEETLIASRGDDFVQALVVRGDGSISPTLEWPAAWVYAGGATLTTVWNGDDFAVAFSDPNGTEVVRVGRDGHALAPAAHLSAESGNIGWNGSRYLFATATREQLLTPALQSLPGSDARPFAAYAADQSMPRIASDGESTMVVWAEDDQSLRAARIAPDGTPLDGDGLVVTSALAEGPGAVAFDGRDWIVAYELYNESGSASANARVAFRRISRDGELSAETTLPAGGFRADSIRVAASPDGAFAIVWAALNPTANPLDGHLRASIDGAASIELTRTQQSTPDVTWSGGAFRMVWIDSEWRTSTPPGYVHQYLAPIDVATGTLTSTGTLLADETYASAWATMPRISGDFVIWSSGSYLPITVQHGAEELSIPTSHFPGADFAHVAIAADRSGRALILVPGSSVGAVLLDGGNVRPFAVAAGGIDVDIAWTSHGWVGTWDRTISDPPFNFGRRVFVKSIDIGPQRRRVGPR